MSNFKNLSAINGEELSKFKDERILFSLSRNSPLLDFLRAMYSLMLDYGVYLGDKDVEPMIFSKEQLVFLIEKGNTELLLRDLPELEASDVIRAIKLDEFEHPDKIQALIIERRGVSIGTLSGAFNPESPDYPAWWTAPIPFAMCGRNRIKLNPAALSEFGADLERLSASALPEKDEFIVELEGREKPFFLSFRRLAAGIFTIEDCTGDLVEAQDISWWAGLGRLWVSLIEAEGRKWRRLEDADEVDNLENVDNIKIWPCEWQDRFMGYFCVENAIKDEKCEDKSSVRGENFDRNERDDKNEIDEKFEKNIKGEKDVKNVKNIKSMKSMKSKKSEKSVKKDKIDKNKDEVKDEIKNEIKNASDADTAGIGAVGDDEVEDKEYNNKNEEIKDDIMEDVKEEDVKGNEVKKEEKSDKKITKKDVKNEEMEEEEEKEGKKEDDNGDDKNDILRAISPQTLGLLAPGLANYYENNYYEEPERVPVKRRLKGDLRL